jgi:hypothetical protein
VLSCTVGFLQAVAEWLCSFTGVQGGGLTNCVADHEFRVQLVSEQHLYWGTRTLVFVTSLAELLIVFVQSYFNHHTLSTPTI